MIATARERIAKFREAEKMVGARGGAERQRERGASSTHIQGGSRHGGTDPESFTYGKKESRLEICVSGSVNWSAGGKCSAEQHIH